MTELSYKLKFDTMKKTEKREKMLEEITASLYEKEKLFESLSFFTKATNKLADSKNLLPMEKIMEKLNIVDIEKMKEEIEQLKNKQQGVKRQLERRDSFEMTLLKVLSSKFKRVFITYTPGSRSDYSTVEMNAADYKEALVLETFWFAHQHSRFEGVILKEKYQDSFECFYTKKLTYEEFEEKADSLLAEIVLFTKGKIGSSHYHDQSEDGQKYLMELTLFKLDMMKKAYADMSKEEYLEIAEDIYSDLQTYNRIIR